MTTHRYVIDVLGESGDAIGRITAQPDWRPALAWVQLEGIRQGRLDPVATPAAGSVEPVWDAAGRPRVAAFRVTVGGVARELPRAYVRGLVERAQETLVRWDVLRPGMTFRWEVVAVEAAEPEVRRPCVPDLETVDVARPLPLVPGSLATFRAGGAAAGGAEPSGAIPVFVARDVLGAVLAAAAEARDVETGGVLVGRLRRDTASPELFVEVTAQLPAPHTRATATALTFTGDTWAALDAALAARGSDEILVGWWHAHLDWCRLRGCPLERRRGCDASRPFFSREDLHFQAACFGAPWHLGLLASDAAITGGLTTTLFGWWQGMVVPRGFHVLDTTKGAIDATPLPF